MGKRGKVDIKKISLKMSFMRKIGFAGMAGFLFSIFLRGGDLPLRYWTAFASPSSFEHISIAQGLLQSTIRCIMQDRRGFLWFGTEDGLNRYDSNKFLVFRHESGNPNSLGADWISCLLEDRHGHIWVGTRGGGLNCLDLDTYAVKVYQNSVKADSLSSNIISSLAEDLEGNLWIGTVDQGLALLPNYFRLPDKALFQKFRSTQGNPEALPGVQINCLFVDSHGILWIGLGDGGLCRLKKGQKGGQYAFEYFKPIPAKPDSSPPANVISIGEDSLGVLWLGSLQGLYSFSPDRKIFRRYTHRNDDPSSLSMNLIWQIYRDRGQFMWIGLNGGGLEKMLPRSKADDPPRFEHFRHNIEDPRSLSSDTVTSICEDNSGVLWVGTFFAGLNKLILDPKRSVGREKKSLIQYRNIPADKSSLSGDQINAIREDHYGNLWVGTNGFGLNRVIPPAHANQRLRFEQFPADMNKAGALQDSAIICLYEDSKQRLWAGSYTGGLIRIDVPSLSPSAPPRFIHFRNDPQNPASLSNNFVEAIFEDRMHRLWIGTNGGGLDLFDVPKEKFKHFRASGPGTLSSNNVYSIVEDKYGTLWLGTMSGLNRFNPDTGEFKVYHFENLPGFSSYSNINILYLDRSGTLWIGATGGGLNKVSIPPWNGSEPRFSHYDTRNGLPSNVVQGILEDDHGQLWLSTNRALCRFDPQKSQGYPFIWEEELRSTEFLRKTMYRSPSGEMFFGGSNGLNIFHPDDIAYRTDVPMVVITDMQLFNQSVPVRRKISGRIILERSIAETREITLLPRDYVFSLEFVVLHYVAPEMNKYTYMMEGLDRTWNTAGNRHFIMYNTLPPGQYRFRVKASNCDGIWGEEGPGLKIRVLPPWWQTWWFRILAGLFLASLIVLVVRLRLRALKQRNLILEALVSERTQELAKANVALQEQSLTDSLTGLRNRRFLLARIIEDIAQVQRVQRDVVSKNTERMKLNVDMLFIMVDLDFFKQVNDRYGHQAGDMVLKQMSAILGSAIRGTDTVVRWGGEEFLIVARNTARVSAYILPERIRSDVEAHPFQIDAESPIHCTCSIGFSIFPLMPNATSLVTWEQTVDLADQCLYAVKKNGRNAWVGIAADTEMFSGSQVLEKPLEARFLPVITSLKKTIQWEDAEKS